MQKPDFFLCSDTLPAPKHMDSIYYKMAWKAATDAAKPFME